MDFIRCSSGDCDTLGCRFVVERYWSANWWIWCPESQENTWRIHALVNVTTCPPSPGKAVIWFVGWCQNTFENTMKNVWVRFSFSKWMKWTPTNFSSSIHRKFWSDATNWWVSPLPSNESQTTNKLFFNDEITSTEMIAN